jgi:hypothetical protein
MNGWSPAREVEKIKPWGERGQQVINELNQIRRSLEDVGLTEPAKVIARATKVLNEAVVRGVKGQDPK